MKVTKYLKQERRRPDRRPLHLKLRVKVTRRMKAHTARRLLDRAIQTGIVPAGIEIRWIDWEKGDEGRASSGQVMGREVRAALRGFYGALMAGHSTRFAKVREED